MEAGVSTEIEYKTGSHVRISYMYVLIVQGSDKHYVRMISLDSWVSPSNRKKNVSIFATRNRWFPLVYGREYLQSA